MMLKLLKLALLIITSGLGIYGTTHDFKKDGKATGAGKIAVLTLILAGLIAIGLQFVDFNKEETAAKAAETAAKAAKDELDKSTARQNTTLEQTNQANKTLERVLGDIDRSLHPLTSISVSVALNIATDSPRMKSYTDRVARTAPRTIDQLAAFGPPDKGIFGWSGNKELSAITFTTRSKLAPQPNERFAGAIFGSFWLEFQFFRKPIDPSKAPFTIKRAVLPDRADLSFLVAPAAAAASDKAWHKFGIGYDIESGGFRIRVDDVQAAPSTWQSSGEIVGIPDLEGTQMFVRVNSHGRLHDAAAERELRELQKAVEIRSTMILHINGGRNCYVDMMQRLESPNGDPVYVFVFPKGQEFSKLIR